MSKKARDRKKAARIGESNMKPIWDFLEEVMKEPPRPYVISFGKGFIIECEKSGVKSFSK